MQTGGTLSRVCAGLMFFAALTSPFWLRRRKTPKTPNSDIKRSTLKVLAGLLILHSALCTPHCVAATLQTDETDDLQLQIDANAAALTNKVAKTGDVMTGGLMNLVSVSTPYMWFSNSLLAFYAPGAGNVISSTSGSSTLYSNWFGKVWIPDTNSVGNTIKGTISSERHSVTLNISWAGVYASNKVTVDNGASVEIKSAYHGSRCISNNFYAGGDENTSLKIYLEQAGGTIETNYFNLADVGSQIEIHATSLKGNQFTCQGQAMFRANVESCTGNTFYLNDNSKVVDCYFYSLNYQTITLGDDSTLMGYVGSAFTNDITVPAGVTRIFTDTTWIDFSNGVVVATSFSGLATGLTAFNPTAVADSFTGSGDYLKYDGTKGDPAGGSANYTNFLGGVTLIRTNGTTTNFTGTTSLTLGYALTNAINLSAAGDLILVSPGNYQPNTNLFVKNGVNFYFLPGATVTNFNAPIFVNATAGTNTIGGYGCFYTTCSTNQQDYGNITLLSGRIVFEFDRAQAYSFPCYALAGSGQWAVRGRELVSGIEWVSNSYDVIYLSGEVDIDVDRVVGDSIVESADLYIRGHIGTLVANRPLQSEGTCLFDGTSEGSPRIQLTVDKAIYHYSSTNWVTEFTTIACNFGGSGNPLTEQPDSYLIIKAMELQGIATNFYTGNRLLYPTGEGVAITNNQTGLTLGVQTNTAAIGALVLITNLISAGDFEDGWVINYTNTTSQRIELRTYCGVQSQESQAGISYSMNGESPALWFIYLETPSYVADPGTLDLSVGYSGPVAMSQTCTMTLGPGDYIAITSLGNANNINLKYRRL